MARYVGFRTKVTGNGVPSALGTMAARNVYVTSGGVKRQMVQQVTLTYQAIEDDEIIPGTAYTGGSVRSRYYIRVSPDRPLWKARKIGFGASVVNNMAVSFTYITIPAGTTTSAQSALVVGTSRSNFPGGVANAVVASYDDAAVSSSAPTSAGSYTWKVTLAESRLKM